MQLNPDVNAFQRKFVHEVRRCDEMERKLRYMESEMKKANVVPIDTGENPEAPPPQEMIDLEVKKHENYKDLLNRLIDQVTKYMQIVSNPGQRKLRSQDLSKCQFHLPFRPHLRSSRTNAER